MLMYVLPYMVDRLRDSDVSIYDHAPTAMEEDPYADSGIYEAIVHKTKVCYFWFVYVYIRTGYLCSCVSVSMFCMCNVYL